MKTLVSYVALTLFVLTSSFTIDVQQKANQHSTVDCFNYFRAHRQGKAVSMTWSVANPDVTSFVIERSYDNFFWETAGSMNSNGNASYKFNDSSVFPGTIYYRITAVKTDGTSECSPIETVRIVQRN